MNKAPIHLFLALIFALALFTGCSEEKATPTEASPEASAENTASEAVATNASANSCTITMNVEGMACGVGCPPVVKKTLLSVTGVDKVDVSFEESSAKIEASGAACEQPAHAEMIKALKAKDYEAKVKGVANTPKDPS